MRESSPSGPLAQCTAQPRLGQVRSPRSRAGRGAAEGPDQDQDQDRADMVSSQPEGPQVLTEPLLGVAEAGGKGQEATHFIFCFKKARS